MIDKNIECDIVSDLLPLYLDGKTGIESREFIRNHVEHCEQCKKTLDYMEISYEDILKNVPEKEGTFMRKKKKIKPFRKAKGRIFVCGYLLMLVLFWIYMIFFLFP